MIRGNNDASFGTTAAGIELRTTNGGATTDYIKFTGNLGTTEFGRFIHNGHFLLNTTTDIAADTLVVNGAISGTGFNISGLTASQAVFTDASKNLTSNPITGTGNVVMSASPTLTGTITAAAATITGTLTATAIASNTGAQTGYLCYNTTGGVITYDGTNTCLVSSRRYKQDIHPLGSGLSEIMRLKPVSYRLKPQYNPSHIGEQIGFIAEDVYPVEPRIVPLDKKGKPRAVEYDRITALLVKAMQEQQAEIAALKNEVRELKAARH